LSRLKRVLT